MLASNQTVPQFRFLKVSQMYGETFRVEGGKAHTLLWKYVDVQVVRTPRLAKVKSALLWHSQESRCLAEPKTSFYFMRLFFHETKTVIKEKNLL